MLACPPLQMSDYFRSTRTIKNCWLSACAGMQGTCMQLANYNAGIYQYYSNSCMMELKLNCVCMVQYSNTEMEVGS